MTTSPADPQEQTQDLLEALALRVATNRRALIRRQSGERER
jgi:hypothetical protein